MARQHAWPSPSVAESANEDSDSDAGGEDALLEESKDSNGGGGVELELEWHDMVSMELISLQIADGKRMTDGYERMGRTKFLYEVVESDRAN